MFPNVSGVGSGRGGRAPSWSIERIRVVRLGEEGVVFPRECCVRFFCCCFCGLLLLLQG